MKAKHYLTALALPLVFAACTNEDDFISNSQPNGETLTIAVTRGGFGADTRAAWVDEAEGAAFEWTKISDDKIGMALLNPSDASKVVTNYEMSLLGWYNGNGEGTKAYGETAQNGVKYTTAYADAKADKNAGAGVFEASGLTVMDGNYIVYHPYDADFAKAGYLAVDFKTNQSTKATTTSAATTVADAQAAMLAAAGDNAFSYSQPTIIEKGGKVAADFATTNLSALVKIALKSFNTATNLKKVILLEDAANFDAASKGFLKSAHLNAEKIKTQSGAAILESPVYTSMVTFAFTDATTPGLTLASDANIYMVAGPRTSAEKYSILLINDENKASIWKSGVNFTAGNKSTINIKDDGNHDFDTFIVTDAADLKTILETASIYDNQTINVLGNLEVEDLGTVVAKNLTIQAYGNNPESSVKFVAKSQDVILASVSDDTKGLVFNVPVTFDSEGDYSITLEGYVSMESLVNNGAMTIEGTAATVKTLTNNGTIDIAVEAVFNTTGDVVNNGTINTAAAVTTPTAKDGATWNIGKNTTLTNKGEINNYFTINNFGAIDNANGTYVQKLEGKFIGQNDIAADKRGNYVIEVKSQDQFDYATGTTCTTIRDVNAEITVSTTVEKKIELTGANVKLTLNKAVLNGGLYVINDETAATIDGTATAKLIQINAASGDGKTAPKLTVAAGSIIKADAIVNNGTGSIKEGATGIPADVKTLSSTGTGTWDNWPQVVTEL